MILSGSDAGRGIDVELGGEASRGEMAARLSPGALRKAAQPAKTMRDVQ